MHNLRSNNLTISDRPKALRDIDPIYVAQTHDQEDLDNPQAWFRDRAKDAKVKGGKFPRFHYRTEEPAGLLFECWTERPLNCGEPRWSFAEK